jgi:hypothetical protein
MARSPLSVRRSADFKNRDKRLKALQEIATSVDQIGNNAHEFCIC